MRGKDYPLDDSDREEWDRLWALRTLRLLPGECKLEMNGFGSLKMKAVALSDDPPEFTSRVFRESEVCPVCGTSTVGCVRVGGHLAVEFERPADWPFTGDPSYWCGVWVHPGCFELCQETG